MTYTNPLFLGPVDNHTHCREYHLDAKSPTILKLATITQQKFQFQPALSSFSKLKNFTQLQISVTKNISLLIRL
jgi:hypothetical protein